MNVKAELLHFSCIQSLSLKKRNRIAAQLSSWSKSRIELLQKLNAAGFCPTSQAFDALIQSMPTDQAAKTLLSFVNALDDRRLLVSLGAHGDAFSLIINCSNLEQLLKGADILITDRVLSFENDRLTSNALDIFSVILKHPYPKDSAVFLSNIYLSGLLDSHYVYAKQNRENILNCTTPYYTAHLFELLERAGLHPQTGLAQNNLDILLQYPAHDMINLRQRVQERCLISGVKQLTQSIFEEEVGLNVVSDRTNLTDMAKDPESSIRPLTEQETRRLEKASRYYQPLIDRLGGVESCIQLLLRALVTRYNQKPIYIEIGSILDKKVEHTLQMRLPIDWDSFMALPLTENNRQKALSLYYAHPLHTSYRFFSELDRRGPWLSPKADWQSVALFKPLIALLWMAVSDTTEPPIDGYTVETRIDLFFILFSDFQRAHNRDKRRERAGKFEYYDDGEADKPGCYIGFKGRALNAVKGNVYICGLTLEKVQYELRKFMHQHFKNKITDENRQALSVAWMSIIEQEPCDPAVLASLKYLNVSTKEQKKFLKNFKREYEELRTSSDLIQYIKDAFNDKLFATHAEKFGGETDLHALLLPPKLRCENLFSPTKKSATSSPVPPDLVGDIDIPPLHYHSVRAP